MRTCPLLADIELAHFNRFESIEGRHNSIYLMLCLVVNKTEVGVNVPVDLGHSLLVNL